MRSKDSRSQRPTGVGGRGPLADQKPTRLRSHRRSCGTAGCRLIEYIRAYLNWPSEKYAIGQGAGQFVYYLGIIGLAPGDN